MITIARIIVEHSSHIDWFEWDGEHMYFGEVGDNVYQYYNVPRNIFDLFIEANNNSESIGTLKSTLLIRGGYEWVRL